MQQPHDDAWLQIGLHLKPRHLAKLMRTSKAINTVVDNDAYWTRVAAHLAWRDCGIMEVHRHPDEFDILPTVPRCLYYMMGMSRGYYWSMERFLKRVDEVIDYYATSADVKAGLYRDWCIELKPMTLLERTKEQMRKNLQFPFGDHQRTAAYLELPIKEIAKTETQMACCIRNGGAAALEQNDARFITFMCDIEDSMPNANKVLERLHDLLADFCGTMQLLRHAVDAVVG